MPQTGPLYAEKEKEIAPQESQESVEASRQSNQPLARRLFRMAALDIGPLRTHRDFRLLFTGQSISFLGSMVTTVALPYQVYTLSHSALAVGLI
ncbi:MAG TPA: hypothetical protein VKQ36_06000, partial [Ktedonobacterales bacterium]|nr:hypothetical protein [Ktedonobacterales bacterium]